MGSGPTIARTLRLLALSVPAALGLLTALYWAGMRYLEATPRTFSESIQWATETMTTTGYGIDGRWHHPVMVAFVVVAQFSGVALIFLILPLTLIPILERRFQVRVPTTTDLQDMLLVYRPGVELVTFLAELHARTQPVVVVETDEARARALLDRGHEVVLCSDPDLLLERISPHRIRAMVTAGPDHENSSLVVEARQNGWLGEVVALVGEADHRRPLQLAGANLTLTPKHVLGAALASRAARRFLARKSVSRQEPETSPGTTGVEDSPGRHARREGDALGAIDSAIVFSDIRVEASSNAANKTLQQLEVGSTTGCTIIGQWRGQVFETPATAETRIAAGSILTAAGSPESINRLQELCSSSIALRRGGHVLIFGFGTVGRVVSELLNDAGEDVITVDSDPESGANLVGDVLSPAVVGRDTSETRAVVIALDSDAKALLATLVVRDAIPQALIVVGLRDHNNEARVRRAGADTVLSLSQVTADLLLERLFGEQRIWVNNQLQMLQVTATRAVDGKRLEELDLRGRSGASLLGIERGGEIHMDLKRRTQVHEGDALVLCGNREALQRAEGLLTSP